MKNNNIIKLIPLLFSLSAENTYSAQLFVDIIPGGSINNALSTTIGKSFDVDIVLNSATDIAGFEFSLNFDQAILSATSISSGDVFGLDGFLIDDTISTNSLSFSEVTFAETGLDIDTAIVVATISFKTLASGTSDLYLSDVILSDSLASEVLPVDLFQANASVSAIPVPSAFLMFFSGLLGIISIKRRS